MMSNYLIDISIKFFKMLWINIFWKSVGKCLIEYICTSCVYFLAIRLVNYDVTLAPKLHMYE